MQTPEVFQPKSACGKAPAEKQPNSLVGKPLLAGPLETARRPKALKTLERLAQLEAFCSSSSMLERSIGILKNCSHKIKECMQLKDNGDMAMPFPKAPAKQA
jgi:hypothetical protein